MYYQDLTDEAKEMAQREVRESESYLSGLHSRVVETASEAIRELLKGYAGSWEVDKFEYDVQDNDVKLTLKLPNRFSSPDYIFVRSRDGADSIGLDIDDIKPSMLEDVYALASAASNLCADLAFQGSEDYFDEIACEDYEFDEDGFLLEDEDED